MREVTLRLLSELTIDERLAHIATLPDTAARHRELSKSTGKDRREHRERAVELDAEWAALVADIERHGVREPVIVVGDSIIDGRHRFMAAKEAGIFEIPTVEVHADQAEDIIFSAVVARRHFTKSGIAYVCVITHPRIATGGAERRAATQFKHGPAQNAGPCVSPLTLAALSKRSGVSLRLLEQAAALYRETENFPALRREAELAIFSGAGLGAVLGLVKARKAGTGDGEAPPRAKRLPDYDRLASESLGTLRNAAGHWADLRPESREAVVSGLRDVLGSLPGDVRQALLSE